MHFVTGGTFNGKRKWVKEKYPEAKWFSAYIGEDLQKDANEIDGSVIVLEGLEFWVKTLAEEIDYRSVRAFIKEALKAWSEWESIDRERQVVVIGTDITKGVVPIEKEKRYWRDVTGRVYQDVSTLSHRVDVIWYGLNQTIKHKGI